MPVNLLWTALGESELVLAFLNASPTLTFFFVFVFVIIVLFVGVFKWLIKHQDKEKATLTKMYEGKITALVKTHAEDREDWVQREFDQQRKLLNAVKKGGK